MKFNAGVLAKDIDSLEGICKDGKKEIKALFTNHFGVKFSSESKKFDQFKLHLLQIGSRCTVKYGDGGGNCLIYFHSDGTYTVPGDVDRDIPIQRDDNKGIKKKSHNYDEQSKN